MSDQISLPLTGYIRLPAILKVFPIGRSTWWLGVRQGRFPAPVKLGPRTTAWRVEDIRSLLAKYDEQKASA
ncbi:MAG: transcriptional regulator [Alphaproteobacteria bacterium CG_4_10_14_0_8_um_filter_53_9]|nr:MAG: transcriptional regulator [Alphaproteobacteria bacterium CG_4_10_14_0_8_um_filter_53_9]